MNSLGMSRSGGFVVTGGMDRQLKIWERTNDMVFVDEEREVALEKMFDTMEAARGEIKVGAGAADVPQEFADGEGQDRVQGPEAAARKTLMTMAAGDRICESLDLADAEAKSAILAETANRRRKEKGLDAVQFKPNQLLLGKKPEEYMLWVLRSVREADLEQALIVLPMIKVERLLCYMIALLRSGQGCEVCSKVSLFLVSSHRRSIVAMTTGSMPRRLRVLKELVRSRIKEMRDRCGFNMAAMRDLEKEANERILEKQKLEHGLGAQQVWEDLGLGSDFASAAMGRDIKRKRS